MKLFTLTTVFALLGCQSLQTTDFEISRQSVSPASQIDWLGQSTALLGEGGLKVGDALPAVRLANDRFKEEGVIQPGQVTLISVVPSLDTEVCDRQTHLLGEAKNLHPGIARVTISRDLPYAQSRFAKESKIAGIRYLSDYVNGEFGRKLGLEIEKNHLLARAILVVDQSGIIRYLQVVPKIYALPDLNAAYAVANQL